MKSEQQQLGDQKLGSPIIFKKDDNDVKTDIWINHSKDCGDFIIKRLIEDYKQNQLSRKAKDYSLQEKNLLVKCWPFKRGELQPDQLSKKEKGDLSKITDSYRKDLTDLLNHNFLLQVELLNLCELKENPLLNTSEKKQEYVKSVVKNIRETLKSKYLKKDGVETKYYYSENSSVTLGETIGLIVSLIKNTNVPLNDQKLMLANLIYTSPELLKGKQAIIQKKLNNKEVTEEKLINTPTCLELLNGADSKIISDLYKEISGFNIIKTWQKQKLFYFTESLYCAKTSKVDDNSDILWDAAVLSMGKIFPEIWKGYTELDKLNVSEGLVVESNSGDIGSHPDNETTVALSGAENHSSLSDNS